jgi:hypothetical protein
MSGVRLAVEVVEFAGCRVAFHLAIPFIVSPAAKFGNEFSVLFRRQFANCSFDFLNGTHAEKMPCGAAFGKLDFKKPVKFCQVQCVRRVAMA